MQNITTTTNQNNTVTYAISDYTVTYSVTLMAWGNTYLAYGMVEHEDYVTFVDDDSEFASAQNAFVALRDNAMDELSNYDAHKMHELLDALARM